MALTRNDKVLILAAITLAAAVVGGLALWRKTMRPAEEIPPAPISAPAPGAQVQPGPAPAVQPGQPTASSGDVPQGKDMPATAGQAGTSARVQAPAAPGAPAATGTVTQPISPETGSAPDPSLGTIFSEKPAPAPEPEPVAPPPVVEEAPAPPSPPVVKKPESKAERKARLAAERKAEQEERRAKAESLKRAKEDLKRAEADLKRAEAQAKKRGTAPAAKTAPAEDKGKALPAPAPALPVAPADPAAPAAPADQPKPSADATPVPLGQAVPDAVPSPAAPAAKGKGKGKSADSNAAVAALKSASQERRTIDKVQVTETSGELSILLKGASTNEAPHSMLLSSPPRLVVDLPGTWAFKGQAGAGPGGSVQRVRIGKYNDKMRVVLDLTALPGKAKDKPPVEKTPDGLLIRLAK